MTCWVFRLKLEWYADNRHRKQIENRNPRSNAVEFKADKVARNRWVSTDAENGTSAIRSGSLRSSIVFKSSLFAQIPSHETAGIVWYRRIDQFPCDRGGWGMKMEFIPRWRSRKIYIGEETVAYFNKNTKTPRNLWPSMHHERHRIGKTVKTCSLYKILFQMLIIRTDV